MPGRACAGPAIFMTGQPDLPELAPVAAFVVLLELAGGSLTVAYLLDRWERIGRGFAGTTALICAAIMGLGVLVGAALPDVATALRRPVAAPEVASAVRWSAGLAVAMVVYSFFCWVGTDAARHVVGAAAIAVFAVALARAVAAFGPALGGSLATAAVFGPAALMAGTATGGMLLGHWYLVTPSMSFRPLRRAVHLVFVALAVEVVTIVAAVATAGSGGRSQLLGSSNAVLFWLLVVGAGVVFTAAVNGLTLYFARIRANQPATAMLYVLIITVLMGVVPAHLLYFRTAIPV